MNISTLLTGVTFAAVAPFVVASCGDKVIFPPGDAGAGDAGAKADASDAAAHADASDAAHADASDAAAEEADAAEHADATTEAGD